MRFITSAHVAITLSMATGKSEDANFPISQKITYDTSSFASSSIWTWRLYRSTAHVFVFYQEMGQFRRGRNSSGILMTTHFFLSNPGLRISRWFFGGNQKQTGDEGTFKLMLFAEGNGCSPDLMRTWILLSQAWNDAKTAEKRSKQIDFIVDNLEQKRASWFYIDINYGKLLLLNGQPKN